MEETFACITAITYVIAYDMLTFRDSVLRCPFHSWFPYSLVEVQINVYESLVKIIVETYPDIEETL